MTMNRLIVIAALLAWGNTLFATEPTGILSTEGPLALKVERAALLFYQCSRGAPIPEGPLWLPTPAEVRMLEIRLEKHMAAIKLGTPRMPAAGKQYRGQYLGFMRAGELHIYASYVPAREGNYWEDFSGDAIIMCDGGKSFWGIVYNTVTGQFSELEVSATRGGPVD